MSKEREIIEQQIKEHQKAIDSAQKKLDGLTVTYSIGDRFKKKGKKFILVAQVEGGVGMASLACGCLQCGRAKVENREFITEAEIDNCCQIRVYTRYWDARKKERCTHE